MLIYFSGTLKVVGHRLTPRSLWFQTFWSLHFWGGNLFLRLFDQLWFYFGNQKLLTKKKKVFCFITTTFADYFTDWLWIFRQEAKKRSGSYSEFLRRRRDSCRRHNYQWPKNSERLNRKLLLYKAVGYSDTIEKRLWDSTLLTILSLICNNCFFVENSLSPLFFIDWLNM